VFHFTYRGVNTSIAFVRTTPRRLALVAGLDDTNTVTVLCVHLYNLYCTRSKYACGMNDLLGIKLGELNESEWIRGYVCHLTIEITTQVKFQASHFPIIFKVMLWK